VSRYGWQPHVPVAVRRARALRRMEKLRRKGFDIKPVEIEGRKIARTFWGKAWCDHLESFSDYQNRLPRGRTYVRNGIVCHLDIASGEVKAMISGSQLYTVEVVIKSLSRKKWNDVKNRCAGQIGSLLELLEGRLSKNVMSVVTDRNKGLFPLPKEISLQCSCPDWAVMCKHVAAVLYGVGTRLDEHPELLFLLRGVDPEALITADLDVATAAAATKGSRRRITDDALEDVFGIELSEEDTPAKTRAARRRRKASSKPTKTSNDAVKRPAKRKAKSGGQTTRANNMSAGVKRTSRADSGDRPVTGKAVAALRAKFDMSQSQFANLLGVSTTSIGNWEKKSGTLNLQTRTLKGWTAAKRLTKRQAWRKLDGR